MNHRSTVRKRQRLIKDARDKSGTKDPAKQDATPFLQIRGATRKEDGLEVAAIQPEIEREMRSALDFLPRIGDILNPSFQTSGRAK